MSLEIEFIFETDFHLSEDHQELLVQLIEKAAQMEGRSKGEVVVTFCDNDHIQDLNHRFRNIDRPTDVLSFPMDEEVLGDIVISIPKAETQAEEYGHSFIRELGFLIVHGFLHLLGYDHTTPQEEEEMFAKQEQVLRELGLMR